MSDLIEGLAKIDDDYLIGISNKGIVKRAYKDLEQASVEYAQEGDILHASVDDCVCQIMLPVVESKCSCPSRSICKHIVMAVIYAKNNTKNTSMEECINENVTMQNTIVDNSNENSSKCGYSDANTEKADNTNDKALIDTYLSTEYSLEKIQKKLGASAYKKVMEYISISEEPQITIGSVITVHFKDIDTTVKLLEPIEYSTCTCHKKELCTHKAQAILYYQLSKGIIQKEQLKTAAVTEEKQQFDYDEIGKLTDTMQDLLGELMFSGLSRTANELVLSCERMAVMCHNLLLADYERRFRSLSENLDLYFKRHASFSLGRLMREVTELYQKTEALKQALATGDIYMLAGKNRSDYMPSKPLVLMGMGQRYFKSKTGYEGDTTYFLEENTGEWYTYTNARPVFYEKNKRQQAFSTKAAAPWNLNCNMEELSAVTVYLSQGKVNDENRLSSTKEASAGIIGKRSLSKDVVKAHIYDDFEKLFEAKFGAWHKLSELTETQKLAIIKPESVEDAVFDSISQVFSMKLLDKENRVLIVKVSYSKEENYTIRYLERLYKRIQRGTKALPLFFGIVYLEEGTMKMYPIEDYEV